MNIENPCASRTELFLHVLDCLTTGVIKDPWEFDAFCWVLGCGRGGDVSVAPSHAWPPCESDTWCSHERHVFVVFRLATLWGNLSSLVQGSSVEMLRFIFYIFA